MLVDAGARPGPGQVARQEFHIEDPAGSKGLVEQPAHLGLHAKELGSTLRVVDRQAQHEAGSRGEQATRVVTRRLAVDVTSEQRHTGTHGHVDFGALMQNLHELVHGLERGCEIGIEIAGVVHPFAHGGQHTDAHRLGLALVWLLVDDLYATGPAAFDATQHVESAVSAAVVDEDEADLCRVLRAFGEELLERVNGESLLLVVAGHHDPISNSRSEHRGGTVHRLMSWLHAGPERGNS